MVHLQLWVVMLLYANQAERQNKEFCGWLSLLPSHLSKVFFYLIFLPFWWPKRYSGGKHLVKFWGISEFLIYFFACCYISWFSLILSFHISCVQGSQLQIFSSDKSSESFSVFLSVAKVCAKLTNISCTMQCLCLQGLLCPFLVLSLWYQNKNTFWGDQNNCNYRFFPLWRVRPFCAVVWKCLLKERH